MRNIVAVIVCSSAVSAAPLDPFSEFAAENAMSSWLAYEGAADCADKVSKYHAID